MPCRRAQLILWLAISFFVFPLRSTATDKPTWSKQGTDFRAGCSIEEKNNCKPVRIPSPDGNAAIVISYKSPAKYPAIVLASIRVMTRAKILGEVPLAASVENEIVWSPDSKAFSVTGNENASGEEHVFVYMLDRPRLGPGNITDQVARDMARTFPACKASNPVEDCAQYEKNPADYIGTSGIDWVGDSSRIVVMAQVPCSSVMGGIMCQVKGYEIEVPSGKILLRMTAREFAKKWQHSMAWKFQIPDPPEYAKQTSKAN